MHLHGAGVLPTRKGRSAALHRGVPKAAWFGSAARLLHPLTGGLEAAWDRTQHLRDFVLFQEQRTPKTRAPFVQRERRPRQKNAVRSHGLPKEKINTPFGSGITC